MTKVVTTFNGNAGRVLTSADAAEFGASQFTITSPASLSLANFVGNSGTTGLRIQTTGSTLQNALAQIPFAAPSTQCQVTVRLFTPTAWPAAVTDIAYVRHSTAHAIRISVGATGNIAIFDASGGTKQSTLLTGANLSTKYRVSIVAVAGAAGAGQMTAKIYLAGGTTPLNTVTWTDATLTTNPFTHVRLGAAFPAGVAIDYGFDDLQMNDGAGGEIGEYVEAAPLSTPIITVDSVTQPTSTLTTDGSIRITWPAISGATRYEAAITTGTVTSGFSATDTNATSPKTFTGLGVGPYTVAVRAMEV